MKVQFILSLLMISSVFASLQQSGSKLKINLFIESLCPDSVNAVSKFDTAIQNGLLAIADLEIVTAGNAKVTGKSGTMYEFTCQNGPRECYGNALESCIWKNTANKVDAFNSIACIYAYTHTDGTLLDSALEICSFQFRRYDAFAMKDCATGMEGNQYSYDAVQATPTHTFVPWETVEGMTLDDADISGLNEDPLNWACAHAQNSDAWNKICAGYGYNNVQMKINQLIRSLYE